jgi:hypothetical protein
MHLQNFLVLVSWTIHQATLGCRKKKEAKNKMKLLQEERGPWWRLLRDKLMYRKRLHSMDPIKYPSSTCPLCKKEDEDEYHFVVG